MGAADRAAREPRPAAAADPFASDFDALEVGAGIVTRGRTITEADLVSFSALTGDWHPQHADASWAASSQFGERIAHGMMVLSYAVGLLPIDPERVVALRGIRQVVFKRPVPIGETIRVHAEIAETKPLDDAHGLVTIGVQVRNPSGKLLARCAIETLWRRRPDEPGGVGMGNGSAAASESRGEGGGGGAAATDGAPAGADASPPGTSSGPTSDGGDPSPVADGRVLI
ncbi:MAG TPA: MaoC/PaaZ C-terminal domain-containing protein [Solirubrobacterales bacterium]|nr:MaoC/PaaZ C-terminal domain-containing protein [Solirubrobacterales bacterium]